MSQLMTFEEMKQHYQGEWLLIAYKHLDDQIEVIEGEVLAHSPNQSDIYEMLTSIRIISARKATRQEREIYEN